MNKPLETFGLRCPDGREAQLLSVQVHAEILGLMLRLTVRQTWRNASGAPMATRLFFPMAWDQTLLDLQLQRPGGAQDLTRVARESREHCSATPGVLATGEQVTVQWRCGQLLQLQGGSLRLQWPAALVPPAPRPADIRIDIHDPVAHGTVSCPSHGMQRVRHAHGLTLSWRAPAGLDKDLVLTVHGLRDSGFALASLDASGSGMCTVLMSGSPRLPQDSTTVQPLRMKLMVESSSALPSERLSQIRTALDKLLAQLQPEDQLSYSRYGDKVVHDLPRLQVCTEAYQRRVRALARHTDADLGMARPHAALQAALAIPDEDEEPVTQADILLIAASPIWAIEAPLRALRAAGHRLHVMALGSAGDSLWRELAEASGGACECLAPGQHSQQSLARLMERMRHLQAPNATLTVEGADLVHRADTPRRVADGDTMHLWACVQPRDGHHDLAGHPQMQAALQWQSALSAVPQALAADVLWDEQGDVARLCAAREALLLDQDEARTRLQQEHRLIVPDLSRFNPEVSLPTLPGMATAAAPGLQRPKVLPTAERPPTLPVRAAHPAAVPAPVRALRSPPPRHIDLAGWLGEPDAPGNPLSALVQGFNAHAKSYGQFRAALSGTLHKVPTRFLDGLVLQLTRQAGNPGKVWAVLMHWLHTEHGWALEPAALSLIEQELANLPVAARSRVHEALVSAALPETPRAAA